MTDDGSASSIASDVSGACRGSGGIELERVGEVPETRQDDGQTTGKSRRHRSGSLISNEFYRLGSAFTVRRVADVSRGSSTD